MANLRFIKLFFASAVIAVFLGLLGASSVHAKNESYKWNGDTIEASGGMFSDNIDGSYLPSTFSKVSDTEYKNYSGDKPEKNKCGLTLTVSADKQAISALSDVVCNMRDGTSGNRAMYYNDRGKDGRGPIDRSGTPITITKEGEEEVATEEACVELGRTWEDGVCLGGSEEEGKSCAIPGIGWMLCPVIEAAAFMADAMYGFIARNFLVTNVDIFDESKPARAVFDNFMTIANGILIVAFLVGIFSQLTGVGINAYGLKKLFKQIIIVAVAANLSWVFLQLLVDVSNILGASMVGLFDSMIPPPDPEMPEGLWDGTNLWTNLVGAIIMTIAGAAIVWASLSTLIPLLFAAVVALGMILFTLLARQALILLLIVIAPLALVAYVLPNTAEWTKKWWKMLFTLLMLYPVIGVVFGASKLASSIVGDMGTEFGSGLIAAGISVLPLFVVPGLLKSALSAAGSVGAKLQGVAGSMTKGTGNWASRQPSVEAMGARENKNRIEQRAGTYQGRLGMFNPGNIRSATRRKFNPTSMGRAMGGDKLSMAGYALEAKEDSEATKAGAFAIEAAYQNGTLTSEAGQNLAMGKDAAGIVANKQVQKLMQARILKSGHEEIKEMIQNIGQLSPDEGGSIETKRMLADSIGDASNAPIYAKKSQISLRAGEKFGVDDKMAEAMNTGAYDAAVGYASAGQGELGYLNESLNTNSAVTAQAKQAVRKAAAEALSSPEIRTKIADTKGVIQNIATPGFGPDHYTT